MDNKYIKIFIRNIVINDNCCWNWQASLDQHGYGQYHADKPHGRAHVFSYNLFKGDVPEGMHVHHKCRNRRCVNPDHLVVVGKSEHARMHALEGLMQADGKKFYEVNHNSMKTHCSNGHPYSGDNLRVYIHNGKEWRQCRECRRRINREGQQRRRQKESESNNQV